ncbi:MAG: carboxypeptidase regulatory-like domain-containing protein [Bacteroidota bacterium]
MSEEIKAKYNCTQSELYAICTLGWNIAKQHQTDISFYYPIYTLIYINGKIANIQTTEQQPDFQTRDAITEQDGILLKGLAEKSIFNWDLLERYITHAFQTDKDLIKPNVEAAGKGYRPEATREHPNWDALKQMLISGRNYIDNNTPLLTPFMPAGYSADYNTDRTNFTNKYNMLMLEFAESPTVTQEKIIANNLIYDELMLMLGDIYVILPSSQKYQASFTYLKGVISSPGPAGLIGMITDSVTNNPLEGALLRLLPGANEAVSEADGSFDFGNISSGKYMIEIILDGYQTLLVPVTIATGVTSTKNYSLVPNP